MAIRGPGNPTPTIGSDARTDPTTKLDTRRQRIRLSIDLIRHRPDKSGVTGRRDALGQIEEACEAGHTTEIGERGCSDRILCRAK